MSIQESANFNKNPVSIDERKLGTAAIEGVQMNTEPTHRAVEEGSIVTVLFEGDEETERYIIVESQDSDTGHVAADVMKAATTSPLGSRLYKSHIGDTVVVNLPHGIARVEVKGIE